MHSCATPKMRFFIKVLYSGQMWASPQETVYFKMCFYASSSFQKISGKLYHPFYKNASYKNVFMEISRQVRSPSSSKQNKQNSWQDKSISTEYRGLFRTLSKIYNDTFFAKIINGFQPLIISQKRLIIRSSTNVLQASKYVCGISWIGFHVKTITETLFCIAIEALVSVLR